MIRIGLADRPQETVDQDDGRCEDRVCDTMVGPGPVVVSWMMGGKLDERRMVEIAT